MAFSPTLVGIVIHNVTAYACRVEGKIPCGYAETALAKSET